MKNIVCPISTERISEHVPRATAFFTIVLFTAYLITGFVPIVIFLAFEFFMRGYNYSQFSIINTLSKFFSEALRFSSPLVDKAPKLFAARLGGLMTLFIILFHFIGFNSGAITISVLVASLSALEMVFSFCVGCYLYSWVVLPVILRK